MKYLSQILLAGIACLALALEGLHAAHPSDLCYEGRPIPDSVLDDFFSFAVIGFGDPPLELDLEKAFREKEREKKIEVSEFEPETIFEWQYIGTLYNIFSIVRVYTWEVGCLGKFTGFLILKREGNFLKISDIVYGGDRHSSMIHEGISVLKGNTLHYSQGITTAAIVDIACEENPGFSIESYRSDNNSVCICYGEAGAFGSCKYSVEISPEGKASERKFISYAPCEGCPDVEELYRKGGVKAVAEHLLSEF